MDCEERIYSNDYFDLMFEQEYAWEEELQAECIQLIDIYYGIRYIPRHSITDKELLATEYIDIPKCFTLLDHSAIEVSGILDVQNQPSLDLKGDGVIIGFVDTGIDYTNPIFRCSDGSTRISAIWDQTIPGNPPEDLLYGTEYWAEEINQALQSSNPLERVPTMDENGHGTFLAGVAAGGADLSRNFIGAAPHAEIAVVKLKCAKPYLLDYYMIPENTPDIYEECDIISGVFYLSQLAKRQGKALVLCFALGSNAGSHSGNNIIGDYLNVIGRKWQHVVVTAAGNESNARSHFSGRLDPQTWSDNIELNVGADVKSFMAEFWVASPELYTLIVTSPTGESTPQLISRVSSQQTHHFIFEKTTVYIENRIVGLKNGGQIIDLRFENPTKGIWTIQVYGINYTGQQYHIWLPMKAMVNGEVFFIRSDPYTTIIVPSNGYNSITVGGYDGRGGGFDIDSGRGYTVEGSVKPDFTAPSVNVYGPTNRGGYQMLTGTSASAAITAGASALFLQYTTRLGYTRVNCIDAKNFFIRGVMQDFGMVYPNREWGYGKLDVSKAFEVLRNW